MGTNDFAYPMQSLQKSNRVASGHSTLRTAFGCRTVNAEREILKAS